MTDLIYLSMFWLGQEGPLIEKAAAETKEKAIIQAQDLLIGLNLQDVEHERDLLRGMADWNGVDTVTMPTGTGSLILTVVRMGDWTEQPHRQPAG